MKKGIYRIAAKLSEYTELPVAELCNESSASLCGRREITFYGCSSVYKYESSYVILELSDTNVRIEGECLRLKTFYRKAIMVSGCINKIEFGVEK